MAKIIIDGKETIFGRTASFAAKELLKGNSVEIINCEEILISGKKDFMTKKILTKRKMGQGASLKGPKYHRSADRLVKRMIRGMLPRDRMKGQEAFKRLKCHVGKGDLKEEDLKKVVTFEHNVPSRYSKVREIVELIS